MKRMIVVFVAAAAGVLVACSPADLAPVPITEITLTATDIAYDTNLLEVVAGQPLRITMRNEGALEHDFNIMELLHGGRSDGR